MAEGRGGVPGEPGHWPAWPSVLCYYSSHPSPLLTLATAQQYYCREAGRDGGGGSCRILQTDGQELLNMMHPWRRCRGREGAGWTRSRSRMSGGHLPGVRCLSCIWLPTTHVCCPGYKIEFLPVGRDTIIRVLAATPGDDRWVPGAR